MSGIWKRKKRPDIQTPADRKGRKQLGLNPPPPRQISTVPIFASYFPLQEHAAIFASALLSRLQGRSAHTASPSLLTKSLSVNQSKKSPKNSRCTPNCETSASSLLYGQDFNRLFVQDDLFKAINRVAGDVAAADGVTERVNDTPRAVLA
jgi:hypothetical protein